jgi:hypothetical protein
MAISPVHTSPLSALLVNPNGSSAQRTKQEGSSIGRTENQAAMRVEISPAARFASATNVVTNNNRQSAASSDYLASAEGQQALAGLRPLSPKANVRV